MTAIIREDAEPIPGTVPAPLRWIVERLLAKEPAERYDSTRDREFFPDGSRLAVTLVNGADVWIVPWPSGPPGNLGASGLTSWPPDSRLLLVDEGASGVADRISLLDTSDRSRRVIYQAAHLLLGASVSPDGTKIAYAGGAFAWNVLEISVPEGRVRTLVGGSGQS